MPAIMPHLELQMPELDPEDIKEEDETSYNHEVVLNLLQRLLDTKDPLSLTDAADRLLDMVYDGEKDHNEYSFECMVKGLAEQIPSDHSAQNELAQLLWKLAPYENMDPQTRTWNPSLMLKNIVYQRTLLLGKATTPTAINAIITAYINWHGFLSVLGQAHAQYPLAEVAILDLRDAFEIDHNGPHVPLSSVYDALEKLRDVEHFDKDQASFKLRSVLVKAASMWVRNNGALLLEQLETRRNHGAVTEHELLVLRAGTLYGDNVYGRVRWDFWKRGFEEAATEEGVVDQDAALCAQEAAIAMGRIEASTDQTPSVAQWHPRSPTA